MSEESVYEEWIMFYEKTLRLPIDLDEKKERIAEHYNKLTDEEREIVGDIESYLSGIKA